MPPVGPAIAIGLKLAVPGLDPTEIWVAAVSLSKIRGASVARSLSDRFRVLSPVSWSNTPGGSVLSPVSVAFPLLSSLSVVSDVIGSNTPAGTLCRVLWLVIERLVSALSPSKSPCFNVRICPTLLWLRSSVPVSAVRCVVVTIEQSVTVLSLSFTSVTSSLRTCGVRAQIPPLGGLIVQSTLRSVSLLTLAWASGAAAP